LNFRFFVPVIIPSSIEERKPSQFDRKSERISREIKEAFDQDLSKAVQKVFPLPLQPVTINSMPLLTIKVVKDFDDRIGDADQRNSEEIDDHFTVVVEEEVRSSPTALEPIVSFSDLDFKDRVCNTTDSSIFEGDRLHDRTVQKRLSEKSHEIFTPPQSTPNLQLSVTSEQELDAQMKANSLSIEELPEPPTNSPVLQIAEPTTQKCTTALNQVIAQNNCKPYC
jgi:hypothetical protein